jgi:hypothetical protein
MSIGTMTNRVPAVIAAALALIERGHKIDQQDIPGLWRINGGPEITNGQLIQIAMEANK